MDITEIYGGELEAMDVDLSFLEEPRTREPKRTGPMPWEQQTPDLDLELPEAQQAAGERGGSGTGAAPAASTPAAPSETTPAGELSEGEDGERESAAGAEVTAPEAPAETVVADLEDELDAWGVPVSLQKTDHQEAVQSAGVLGGSSAGGDEVLPRSPFRIASIERTKLPAVKYLPDDILALLRAQLQTTAVRELSVEADAAHEYVQALGQSSIVMAYLCAYLDVPLELDPATARAAELFRARDPLLGAVAQRLARLEAFEHAQAVRLQKVQDEVREVRQTSGVIEQFVAYQVADREVNFLAGSHDHRAVPITDKAAIQVRDRGRELTKKQLDLEKQREGRPIR